jgi:gamma-aminobutyric acid type B receptor
MKALSLLMFSINVVAGVTGGVWVFMHKTAPVVQMAQPFFLYLLVLGCIVSSATIIPMGAENSDLKDLSAANTGCAIFPWLYSVGFCITFGTLFSKIWRVHKIFSAASKMQRAKVSIGDTLRMIMALLLIDVVILTIWTTSDPLKWTRTTLTSDVSGYPLSSAGQCESPSSGKYLAALGTLHALVMVYASYLCYQTRNIPTEFAGGKYVALAMASNLQVFLLGVPVMVIVGNDPSTSFFVRSAIIFLNDFAVLAFILGNIVFSFYTQGNKVSADASATSMTSATSKTAMTSKTQLNFGSQNSSEHAVEAVVPTKEVEAVVPAKEVESAIDGPPIVVVQPAEEVQSA